MENNIEQFNPTIAELTALVEATKNISATDLKDKKQLEIVKASRKSLSEARINIAKKGKELRQGAIDFQKAVIEKEKELIAIISPEEDRLKEIEAEAKEIKQREERLAVLPQWKEKLAGIGDKETITDEALLAMDYDQFITYFNQRVADKNESDRKAIEDEKKKNEEEAKRLEWEKGAQAREEQARKDEKERIEREAKEEEEEKEKKRVQIRENRKIWLEAHGFIRNEGDAYFVNQELSMEVAVEDVKNADYPFDSVVAKEVVSKTEAKEKAEREAEEKTENRIKELVSMGLKLNISINSYVLDDFCFPMLDILTYDDDKWARVIIGAKNEMQARKVKAEADAEQERLDKEAKAEQARLEADSKYKAYLVEIGYMEGEDGYHTHEGDDYIHFYKPIGKFKKGNW